MKNINLTDEQNKYIVKKIDDYTDIQGIMRNYLKELKEQIDSNKSKLNSLLDAYINDYVIDNNFNKLNKFNIDTCALLDNIIKLSDEYIRLNSQLEHSKQLKLNKLNNV